MKNIFKKMIVVGFAVLLSTSTVFADVINTGINSDNMQNQKNIYDDEFIDLQQTSKIFQDKGIVKEIKEYRTHTDEVGDLTQGGIYEGEYIKQILYVKLLTGNYAGRVIKIENNSYNNPFSTRIKQGDKLFLYGTSLNGEFPLYTIRDYWHSDGLVLWSIIFLVLVIALGGKAGIKAVLSLFISIAVIFGVFISSIKGGHNPVLIALVVSGIIILITHLIITGTGRKSWAAMLGTMGGVMFGAFTMYLVAGSANITGLGSSVSRDMASMYPDYDYLGILFSGIILGALGAVMDTGISIASGMHEVKHHSPNITRKHLIASGFRIGKDILGSMINTLVFAYIGAALISVLSSLLLDVSMIELLNYGFIAEEVVRSLVGSFGLLATIPLTALISGYLLSGQSVPIKKT